VGKVQTCAGIFGKVLSKLLPRAKEVLKYIGPGMFVTVGFIDPGNWASNIAAGSDFGYSLLWMVTLSTIMLIILQHNVAHLGIVTGDCMAEAASKHLKPLTSRILLLTAIFTAISTALAEILGGAIALNLLFNIPIRIGSIIICLFVIFLLFTNSYRSIERLIIGFVSIIGFSFIYEISIIDVNWGAAVKGWVTPSFPDGSIPIIMAVLGAVVMPHNLFLHSEVIQSREWNKEEPQVIKRQLKFEFTDTLISMIIGWAINSAMIILAASVFFAEGIQVTELDQAQKLLEPLLGKGAAVVFGIALLFSGISSTTTAGLAGGSIYSGLFRETYDIRKGRTRFGTILVFAVATLIIFAISDPFKGLIYSQIFLSIQLPFTIALQIYLTSSEKVMGEYKNTGATKIILCTIAVVVTALNIILLFSYV